LYKYFILIQITKDRTLKFYEQITEKINCINDVLIMDVENEIFTPTLLDMVKNSIDNCNLFICDITSYVPVDGNQQSLINLNVIIELGMRMW
jgi:hypothetical protein